MNEAERERLIKKDIASIENRVRHAFNQGYEMGLKESRSENPNTCGDVVSRQAVLDAFWKLNIELSPTAIWTIQNMIKDVPSVSPQQRTGRWIRNDECVVDGISYDMQFKYKCDKCGCPVRSTAHNYCPNCGAKMEVEDAD